uniref:Synaptic vesicular amine transporter n=1 Tax=Mesocestoides corti TaxID=53468 RepID=A0A5K3FWW2_MESCO
MESTTNSQRQPGPVSGRMLHRRQTTLDSMPPPQISPDGFPIYMEPPHSDAPDVGAKVNFLTRLMHILMCKCTKRYYMAWMCSLGFMITFGIRCNMSWVTLAMEHHAHLPTAEIAKLGKEINVTTVSLCLRHQDSKVHEITKSPLGLAALALNVFCVKMTRTQSCILFGLLFNQTQIKVSTRWDSRQARLPCLVIDRTAESNGSVHEFTTLSGLN